MVYAQHEVLKDLIAKRLDAVREDNIFKKDVLQFRSFVCEPMQYGRLFLAGSPTRAISTCAAKSPSWSWSPAPRPRPRPSPTTTPGCRWSDRPS